MNEDNIAKAIIKIKQSLDYYNHTQDYHVLRNKDKIDIVYKLKSDTDWTYSPAGHFKLVYDTDETNKATLTIVSDKEFDQKARIDKLYSDKLIITNHGLIIDLENKTILKTHKNEKGYEQLFIKNKNKTKVIRIHRIVAHAFCPKPERHQDKDYSELEVNHIDGIKNNNYYTNLEWCTHKENQIHGVKNGLLRSGENSTTSKFSNKEIENIRNEWINLSKDKTYTIVKHSLKYNIATSTMQYILKNESYIDNKYLPNVERISLFYQSGENNNTAKLNQQQVDWIRSDYIKNKYPFKFYANKFKVSVDCIRLLIYNKTYKDDNYIPTSCSKKQIKITDEQAKEIREDYLINRNTFEWYSNKYDVTIEYISNVINNKTHYCNNYKPLVLYSPSSTLTKEQVNWIRKHKQENHNTPHSYYANMFKISRTTITNLLNNKVHYDPNYVGNT